MGQWKAKTYSTLDFSVWSSFLRLPEITKQLRSKAPQIVSQRLDFQRVCVGCICRMVVESAAVLHQRDMPALPTSGLPAPG